MCWDIPTLKPVNVIKAQGKAGGVMNAINTLDFMNNSHSYLVGTRDGIISVYDTRTKKPEIRFKAHENKLNNGKFGECDRVVMTAGRDSCIRVWDLRSIKEEKSDLGRVSASGQLLSLGEHTCTRYNISASFISDNRYAITGSEDHAVYIYSLLTGKLVGKYPIKPKISHLVTPVPNAGAFEFLYSGLNEDEIYKVQATDDPKAIATSRKEHGERLEVHPVEAASMRMIERIMAEHGDFILKVFHETDFQPY